MRFLFSCALLCLAASCTDANRASTATGDPRFHMSDPNELFFRNTQQNKYRPVENATADGDVFQVAELRAVTARPQLFGQLVLNWLEDEAYFRVTTNDYEQQFEQPLVLVTEAGQDIVLGDASPRANLDFGELIARDLQAGKPLRLRNAAGEAVSIFQSREEREAFLTTLGDFYRLTQPK